MISNIRFGWYVPVHARDIDDANAKAQRFQTVTGDPDRPLVARSFAKRTTYYFLGGAHKLFTEALASQVSLKRLHTLSPDNLSLLTQGLIGLYVDTLP